MSDPRDIEHRALLLERDAVLRVVSALRKYRAAASGLLEHPWPERNDISHAFEAVEEDLEKADE